MGPKIREEFAYKEVERLGGCKEAEAQRRQFEGCGQEVACRAAWASEVMLWSGKGSQVARPSCDRVRLQWMSSGSGSMKRERHLSRDAQSSNSGDSSDC